MLGHSRRKEIGAVDVDAPQFANPVNGVGDGIKVLCETSRGDEMIDAAMLLDNLGERGVDRVGVRDIGIVRSDLG